MESRLDLIVPTSILPRLNQPPVQMQRLDRLTWAAGTSFVSHGARIGIRVSDATILKRLPDHLPPGWRPSPSPLVDGLYSLIVAAIEPEAQGRRYNLLYAGPERLARTTDLDEMFETLEFDLHFRVASLARRRLFVHAGVVGWRGRAIVIPGRSGSGKTSLVAAMVRAGATYYSDEYASFDPFGRVHPYPKPLFVRGEGGTRLKRYPVEAFGGRTGTAPLHVGMIVVAEYQPGVRWRPRALSPGHSLLALLSNTVLARIRPDFALDTLRRVTPGALTLKGKRGEAREVVGPLLKQLEGR